MKPRALHVQAAVARPAPQAVQPLMARPAVAIAPGQRAPHVEAALRRGRNPAPPPTDQSGESAEGVVLYEDRKNLGGPVPPPKRPVQILRCAGDGTGCTLTSVETGRVKQAGTVYAGFVRMSKHGDVYIAERQAVDMPGDSHPSIASATPEGRSGKKKIVAAGEVGIIDNEIVGHNDKTGHYQTRKNKQQSGLPADRYYPYTVHPKEWYKPSK